MSKTTFTDAEAAQIAVEYTRKRVAELAKSLKELRERELSKAIVPPHKHNTGTTSSSGVEDVPPGKMNPPGKNDALKEEMSAHKPEETSGEKSPDDLKKESLCKMCGKSHGLEKGCTAKPSMDKAMLKDSKGKEKDNGVHPDSVLPEDKDSEEVSHDGSGGEINKVKKSLADIRKSAQPPMAKPPSGKNMGTSVPTSAPATPKTPMAKEVKEMVVHNGGKGKPAPKGADYEVKNKDGKTSYVRKEELDKGVLSDIAMRNSPPGPTTPAPAPAVQLPTPAQHADRASQFASFTPGAGQTGHLMGGKGASANRPGIFGRLNKSEVLAKKTPVPFGQAGDTNVNPVAKRPATTTLPVLKPAATGMHTVGGAPATTSMTGTVASPDKTAVVPPPAAAVARNVLGKPAAPASPVLVPRPAVKLPGAHLKTAGASSDNTEGDKTQQTATIGAKPSTIKPKV